MTEQIYVATDKIEFLKEKLGNNIEILDGDKYYTKINITINGGRDLLILFHAGIEYGMDIAFG